MAEDAIATLAIPQVVLDAAQMSAHDLRLEPALTLYAQQRLSLGKACELAGLTLWEFRHWLGLRRIEAHYDADDLQDEIDTYKRKMYGNVNDYNFYP
ncbi:MAG: UPF0175 family protein [Candidatus Competibacter sp.]|nr:UPF0175 family protein [Candidatus Competibacter sp.]MDG4604840.1 UPF0175 family protein [Candidatus Contendobacter sp.]